MVVAGAGARGQSRLHPELMLMMIIITARSAGWLHRVAQLPHLSSSRGAATNQ